MQSGPALKQGLAVLEGRYAIVRLPADADVPAWVDPVGRGGAGGFFSVTRTEGELSLVLDEGWVPGGVQAESDWVLMRVEGTLEFGLIGVLADLTRVLAGVEVSVFVLSTYDTDYLLVKADRLPAARAALAAAGHSVVG